MSFLMGLVLIVGFFIWPLLQIGHDVLKLKSRYDQIKISRQQKNFTGIQTALAGVPKPLNNITANLKTLSYLKWVPGISGYWKTFYNFSQSGGYAVQGIQTMMPALDKAAPLFGYRTATVTKVATVSGKQKIAAFAHALPTIAPALLRADKSFTLANQYLQAINPKALPGHNITSLQQFSNGFVHNIPTIAHSVSIVQSVLGIPSPKRYLLIFQNSGELRPTGGFMTAYGYVNLNNGLLGKLTAHNIYSLANVVQYRPPAPPILGYVYTQHWHIRDANLSPNVPTTVGYIYRFYDSIPDAPHVNGVIFVDTWFVDNLLKAVGPITMPKTYHNLVITSQNANYEMEYLAERAGYSATVRKKFIGVMMHILIHKVMSSHGSQLARVISVVSSSLAQKLVLLNFNNPAAESLVKQFNWGGTVAHHVKGDYLQVVDANLGGHKDNYFMHYYVNSNITKVGDRYLQSTRITWVNPAVLDHNWLVVPYKAWVRVFVPYGSQLVSITGNVNGVPEQYNNNRVNKTVFGDHIDIPGRKSLKNPPAKGGLTFKYWLPKGMNPSQYVIQKQPGVRGLHETIHFGSFSKQFYLTQDTTIHF